MTKGPTKQRCIRLGGDLEPKVEELAERNGVNFSTQVRMLLRQALAQRAYAGQSQHSAAA